MVSASLSSIYWPQTCPLTSHHVYLSAQGTGPTRRDAEAAAAAAAWVQLGEWGYLTREALEPLPAAVRRDKWVSGRTGVWWVMVPCVSWWDACCKSAGNVSL